MSQTNSFWRSVTILASGTVTSQIITFVASLIIARIYSPADFGIMAVFGAILGILSVIACLRYELAIPLPQRDCEAATLAAISITISIIASLSCALLLLIFREQIVSVLGIRDHAGLLWFLPCGLLLAGGYQTSQQWAIRTELFSRLAKTRVAQSIVMTFVQIAGHSFGPIALILGRVVGQGIGTLALSLSAWERHRPIFSSLKSKNIRLLARKHKEFPLVSTWAALAGATASNLPPIFIAGFLGATPAGAFALAHRLLSQPMLVFGNAVGDVFYRQAALAADSAALGALVSRLYRRLVSLAFAPALFAVIVLPDTFIFAFGARWKEAGDLAQLMIPWLFFQLVITPSTNLYPILNQHSAALRFHFSLLASTTVCLTVGIIYYQDLDVGVGLLTIVNSAIYLLRGLHTFKLVGLKKRELFYGLYACLPAAFVCSLPVLLLKASCGNIYTCGLTSVSTIALSVMLIVIVGIVTLKHEVSR